MGKHLLHIIAIKKSELYKRATGELFCFGAMDANIGNIGTLEKGRARGMKRRRIGRMRTMKAEERNLRGDQNHYKEMATVEHQFIFTDEDGFNLMKS